MHFATSTHQAPHAQKGEPGEERWIRLELRLIADVGLVGLPNAGKSTLLAALTAARPKIADYPFTTLEPNLGVLDLGDDDERRPTIADVPGLIEGASSGAGLGHAFLRHVERTRILVHVVDGSSRDPGWDHDVIREELAAHDPLLLTNPTLVVLNKLDLPDARTAWPAFEAAMRKAGIPSLPISAETGEGLDALRAAVGDLLPDADQLAAPPDPAGVVVHRLEAAGDGFRVRRGGRLSSHRPAHRADRQPDELRRGGIGAPVPARPGAPRRGRGAAPGGHRAGRQGSHRHPGTRVGTEREVP